MTTADPGPEAGPTPDAKPTKPDVWIPADAPDHERARLAEMATVHLFPLDGEIDGSLAHADLLITAAPPGQRQGRWLPSITGDDLDGATVAIVGAGSIGAAVEARLSPFGARFVRWKRRSTYSPVPR